jgi:sigma-B regulation protein RsbU (phosphoserine phosphatase)
MEMLPPVHLGVSILVSYIVVFIIRFQTERLAISAAANETKAKRQFFTDFSLCVGAGAMAALANAVAYGMPFKSAATLIFGYFITGFFISLDTGLARERNLIQDSSIRSSGVIPPGRLYPMTRKFSFVAVITVVFIVIVVWMVISRDLIWLAKSEKDPVVLSMAQKSVIYEIIFIMGVLLIYVINLIISYAKNLNLLFKNETGVLERVSKGDLSEMVPVVTNDEFGFIAGHTNTMINGLRHRSQLITSLKLAEEVQQNLLPQKSPLIPGIDLAGKSIYCDETGGDYFDYFKLPHNRLGIIVADAADHGVGSALYMATARAFLRYGIGENPDPSVFLKKVNQYLTMDSEETGRFMTLFFIEIDMENRRLCWIRAGHEPAILFDPVKNQLSELSGKGIALGLKSGADFKKYHQENWPSGAVLVVYTDGIREAQNSNGEEYGLVRFKQVIKDHAHETAENVLDAMISSLGRFQQGAVQEDDVTLVVVKLE